MRTSLCTHCRQMVCWWMSCTEPCFCSFFWYFKQVPIYFTWYYTAVLLWSFQKCLAVCETSLDLSSAWGWANNDRIFIWGWTYPLNSPLSITAVYPNSSTRGVSLFRHLYYVLTTYDLNSAHVFKFRKTTTKTSTADFVLLSTMQRFLTWRTRAQCNADQCRFQGSFIKIPSKSGCKHWRSPCF